MSTEPETPTTPEPIDLGDGRTVLFDEATSGFYRVRMPNGEVQAFPARGEATPDNALADLVTDPAPEPPPPVPETISRAEFIIALRRVLGLEEATIFALISGISDPEEQETARDLFEHCREFRRNNRFLLALAAMEDVTPEQIDEIFRTGAALELD